MSLIEKLKNQIQSMISELGEIDQELISTTDSKRLVELGKRRSEVSNLKVIFDNYQAGRRKIEEAKEMLEMDDEEMKQMAETEIETNEKNIERLEKEILDLIIPDDETAKSDSIIIEIRAGAGGDEASLFAEEIMQMYLRYAENNKWKVDVADTSYSDIKGIKSAIFMLKGNQAYKKMRFESGVHRVQRIPETESAGRIHTSTITVAVLPEAKDTDIDVKREDLIVDVFRSSGPGGQSVNTTDSAVRIKHIPTGLIVTCQDEKSQHQNKDKAMIILKTRLLEKKRQEEKEKEDAARAKQIGTGERSEKIRTYNFPQSRVTDHRIKHSTRDLLGVMNGKIDEFVDLLNEENLRLRIEKGMKS